MSNPRLSPVKREDVPQDAQGLFDNLVSISEKAFGARDKSNFIWQQRDGALVGPYPLLLAAPGVGALFLELNRKIAALQGLPDQAREIAIVAVGAHFRAAYEVYAHTSVGKDVGVPKEQIEAIANGRKPAGLSAENELAYDIAHHLASRPGPLPRSLWDRSIEAFGKEGTLALLHYTAFYAYTCVILNGMDAPVPGPDD